jgi:hypothetical protein
MYRFGALADRLFGLDANNILNNYTDIRPGRPTVVEHRHPNDDLRTPYNRATAAPVSKIQALTLLAAEQQTRDYYMNVGPMFADTLARQLYAEIASIEEQHVTQYESIIDPEETWLEKWLMHEAVEVWNYASCAAWEQDARIKAIWQRFTDYELGHLHFVMELFQRLEKRDPFEILPQSLPEPVEYRQHRKFVRNVLDAEVDLRTVGAEFVDGNVVPESAETLNYRRDLNASGSPSEAICAGYVWRPGTELTHDMMQGRAK